MSNEEKIEEYQNAIKSVVLCSNMIAEHDLSKLLADIEFADSFGPILDPTLWREKHRAMLEDKKILEAALPLWRLAQAMKDAIMKRVEEAAVAAEEQTPEAAGA